MRIRTDLIVYGCVALVGLAVRSQGRAGAVDVIVGSVVSAIPGGTWSRVVGLAALEFALSAFVGLIGAVLVASLGGRRGVGFALGLALVLLFQVVCFVPIAIF